MARKRFKGKPTEVKKRRTKNKQYEYDPRDSAVLTDVPMSERKANGGYAKCLTMTYYGTPIADTRPRFVNGVAVSVNLGVLAKRFKIIVQKSEMLQKLFIHSTFSASGEFYMPVSKIDMKLIKDSKTQYQDLLDEKIRDVSVKDNDNMCKINLDILQDIKFNITVDDAYCVDVLYLKKIMSLNPRTVYRIFFNTREKNIFHSTKILGSAKFYNHMVSYKWMLYKNRTAKQQLKYLTDVTNVFIQEHKVTSVKGKIDVVKRLAYVLEYYPASVLKDIGGIEATLLTRYDVTIKIVLMVMKKHKDCTKKIVGIKL